MKALGLICTIFKLISWIDLPFVLPAGAHVYSFTEVFCEFISWYNGSFDFNIGEA